LGNDWGDFILRNLNKSIKYKEMFKKQGLFGASSDKIQELHTHSH
jgi:hypothetical protein